ncbi:arginine biosynthesis ArgJ [Heliocybe sulcata]|uniref:Arginine biosynthesis bifunctional protein ArgJ, mitochondrial n=1 Tax=Heliocybe sulcata TaxID=5364 RepID=A0A5C3N2Q9_9AGAM|nr:arginine biosynthesis ArgJ [Heliocybe sulcata]
MASPARTLWKRFSSTITPRPGPPKAHHHAPIPDSSFPKGYLAGGVHCGIKKKAGLLDLGLILSEKPASAAACFTRNAFKAAPVVVSQDVLERGGARARGIVVNSGCANAVTGKKGMEDAWAMVRAADALLDPPPKEGAASETLVMSTGVIGQNLPIEKIIAGIQAHKDKAKLGAGFEAWERVARAFMTTDTFPKLRARTFTVKGREYRMAGIDKGAGMIHPDMGPPASSGQLHATLLGCIVTDAAVSPKSLQDALTYAVERSFNSISVDGDMSTNDTIIVLANGAAAEGREIDEATDKEAYEAFKQELTSFAIDLAKLVVRDGEGATKFATVTVEGAPTYSDAHKVASRISTSALVKTALYGQDANWGRILAATGSIPLSSPIDPTRVSVTFVPADGSAHLPVLVNGEPEKVDEVRAKEILSQEDFEMRVDLGLGSESAQYYTCDLSYVSAWIDCCYGSDA